MALLLKVNAYYRKELIIRNQISRQDSDESESIGREKFVPYVEVAALQC